MQTHKTLIDLCVAQVLDHVKDEKRPDARSCARRLQGLYEGTHRNSAGVIVLAFRHYTLSDSDLDLVATIAEHKRMHPQQEDKRVHSL